LLYRRQFSLLSERPAARDPFRKKRTDAATVPNHLGACQLHHWTAEHCLHLTDLSASPIKALLSRSFRAGIEEEEARLGRSGERTLLADPSTGDLADEDLVNSKQAERARGGRASR